MPRRTAAEILAELEGQGVRHDLVPFRRLLAALGAPERELRALLLVAGTNGKGAVSALVASIASAAGLHVGLYTSPHLERWHERIRIGDAEIEEERLAALVTEALGAAERHGLETPTPFEALTAAALLAFRDAGVELAVLEVGVGGRLDATNAAQPTLSLITRVARDHHEWLGGDLPSIAREKAGILRPGVPAIIAGQDPEVESALAEEAERVGAPLRRVTDLITVEQAEWRGLDGHRLRLRTPSQRLELELPLAGMHQIDNVALATCAAETLAASLPSIDGLAIVRGIARCRWPGRIERLSIGRTGPDLVLDAAHNPDGCAALSRFLERLGEPYVLVFGVLADKDVRGMLPPLAHGARSVVLARPPSPRACEPTDLVAFLPDGAAAEIVAEPVAAVQRAVGEAVRLAAAHVVVCGSIYLVGAVRAQYTGRRDAHPTD
jgi:dihydrofolate synthase/folylpolyglutamate synthase